MGTYHLTLGANLLLWVFPLVLTVVVIVLAFTDRTRDEKDLG
jgi:cytochrome c-type biogenesis protein CcmH/NrfF